LPRHAAGRRRVWRVRESKHAAKRAEDAAGSWRGGQQFVHAGFGEEVAELRGIGRRLVAEGADQPAFAVGEMESTLSGFLKGKTPSSFRGAKLRPCRRAACLATPRSGVSDAACFATAHGAVSGEAGHQALESAGRPVEAGPERDDEGEEAGLLEEAARDGGAEAGQDQGEAAGEAGGEGAERGWERGEGHW
jgi:hypothetical protein